MLNVSKNQMDDMDHASWDALAPRLERFLTNEFGEQYTELPGQVRSVSGQGLSPSAKKFGTITSTAGEMMSPEEFSQRVPLYELSIDDWRVVDADLVVSAETANYNSDSFVEGEDDENTACVLIFKNFTPLDDETSAFEVPENGDATVYEFEFSDPKASPKLRLVCRVDQYASDIQQARESYAHLNFSFDKIEIVER